MNIEEIRKQAQNENTAPEILAELANSEDKLTRQYVASNPNTSIKVLERLGKEFSEVITDNPIFNLLFLENPHTEFIRISLARSSTTSAEILARLADLEYYHEEHIVRAVARNPNVPVHVLEMLANDEHISVKNAVVNNKNTPTEIFDKLSAYL
ncbi:hypothetical protein [Pleurocapsa sp. FMAR1]|uniref:hypothetical protein n=1 Tax=Pleurocapsa sp. FMAR1 TaxID=3040204 RepID=UPI0029C88D27|nr:hypothetical protein [Pleurocapsa sp. FMAR1]